MCAADRSLLYIPIWYNSSNIMIQVKVPVVLLYIPIWYNSSLSMLHVKLFWEGFTFQSGTIQAKAENKETIKFKLYIPIWYNSSSNILTSWGGVWLLYIPIWYNSSSFLLQRLHSPICTLHSNLVQFKLTKILPFIAVIVLYIPIWYNSSLLPFSL